MPHGLIVTHNHNGQVVPAYVVPWRGRNGYTLRHEPKRPKDIATFETPKEAVAALDTLWDNAATRSGYEVIDI